MSALLFLGVVRIDVLRDDGSFSYRFSSHDLAGVGGEGAMLLRAKPAFLLFSFFLITGEVGGESNGAAEASKLMVQTVFRFGGGKM
jgi:hypothetical protein